MSTGHGQVLDHLTVEHLPALEAGAVLLGSGGGGGLSVGAVLLRTVLAGRSIDVVPAADLPADATIIHVGDVGSPDVIAERLLDGAGLTRAIHLVSERVGSSPAAVGIIEIGGLNALTPLAAAAHLGLPVVDGDLMGRAFPSIRQTTLAIEGLSPTPIALVDPGGAAIVIEGGTPARVEALLQAAVGAMGGAAAIALYAVPAGQLAARGVAGSLTACERLGRAYLATPPGDAARLADALGGRVLFTGRVDDLVPQDGSAPGSLTLTDDAAGTSARVDHFDEFLAVAVDGVTIARAPHVIVALNEHDHVVLRTDQVRAGQRLVIMGLPALNAWAARHDAIVGPAGYGIDLEEGP